MVCASKAIPYIELINRRGLHSSRSMSQFNWSLELQRDICCTREHFARFELPACIPETIIGMPCSRGIVYCELQLDYSYSLPGVMELVSRRTYTFE